MKQKKIFIYLLSMIIPAFIFFIAATINGFLPFGEELLNCYDSFTQYSGMLLEYSNLIKNGNIFYSWGAGLGFNFFGTLTYYCLSPLNLFVLFANSQNYPFFIAIMTYVRFMLLGGSMCFYLSHKEIKPQYVVFFSTIYALMGYTATYYYNYIWIDSVIMLPLVIHGLDKLLKGKSPKFYIFTLAFTILINYYIGYMICIFSLIWFLYNIIHEKEKKKITKTFIISSIISGMIGAITIIPSFFALMTGKASLFNQVNYFGISRNVFSFFYSFTIGSYQTGDQGYGPALIYITIFGLVLTIFYFFNKNFSKKEKIATLAVIIFFYLSFCVNLLNFSWQLFQKPIWWQSRFSFVFSFFLITVAIKTLMNIDKTDFKTKPRIIITVLSIVAMLIGAYFKWQVTPSIKIYTYIFLGFSILVFIEMMFLLDKKGFMTMLMIFTTIELTLNTYNALKNNYKDMSYKDYISLKENLPVVLDKLEEENDNFYRFELVNDYTSDDGLYFGFNGINYFNSVRNINTIELIENLGVTVYDKCHIELLELDPVVLSLLNIKYLYGKEISYLENKDKNLSVNPYPLGLGFMSKSDIKDVTLGENTYENKENILKSLSGIDKNLYKNIPYEKFEKTTEDFITHFKTSFKSDRDYLLMPEFDGYITLDDETTYIINEYVVIKKGQNVTIEYNITNKYEDEEVFATLLDLENYKTYMEALQMRTMNSKTNTSATTILESTITSDGEYDYLFTSIEYEKGMTVYVDGEKIEPDIVLGALIGLPLEEGEHTIKITYIPRGFMAGAALSITGVLSSLIYLQRRKKVI